MPLVSKFSYLWKLFTVYLIYLFLYIKSTYCDKTIPGSFKAQPVRNNGK